MHNRFEDRLSVPPPTARPREHCRMPRTHTRSVRPTTAASDHRLLGDAICGGPLTSGSRPSAPQIDLEHLNRLRFSNYLQQHQYTSDIDDISIIVSAFPSSIQALTASNLVLCTSSCDGRS